MPQFIPQLYSRSTKHSRSQFVRKRFVPHMLVIMEHTGDHKRVTDERPENVVVGIPDLQTDPTKEGAKQIPHNLKIMF